MNERLKRKNKGRKILLIIVSILLVLGIAVFIFINSMKIKDVQLDVPNITVTSASVDSNGRLLTVCASDRSNNPAGQNQSPQLSWSEVPEADYYVVMMFDEDANWLHWCVDGMTKTTLEQGAYNDTYAGPYPPWFMGRHKYRIEVFALREPPDSFAYKINSRTSYAGLVNGLDTAGGNKGNILARGHIVGTYKNGDNN